MELATLPEMEQQHAHVPLVIRALCVEQADVILILVKTVELVDSTRRAQQYAHVHPVTLVRSVLKVFATSILVKMEEPVQLPTAMRSVLVHPDTLVQRARQMFVTIIHV